MHFITVPRFIWQAALCGVDFLFGLSLLPAPAFLAVNDVLMNAATYPANVRNKHLLCLHIA